MKKLLILGGSKYIIPVIKKAHDLGIFVITCDYLPDNYAHKYSDQYLNISILDKDLVLKAAKQLKIDGIMSFACDPGVVTAAYVAEKLNLPTSGPLKSVEILQNKGLFRKFLQDNGFNVPKSMTFSNVADVNANIDKFDFPIIVKPVDSAGSKGVKRVDNFEELENAVKNALSFSHSNSIIIEDFLEQDGYSSDCDSMSINGKMVITTFGNQMFDKECANPYTPSGMFWPCTLGRNHQDELKKEIQRLISLLGMTTSIYNIETRVAKNGKPYIMEVSPRGGGNRLSEMVELVYGIDMISNYIRYCVGLEMVEFSSLSNEKYIVEVILHSKKSGLFKSVYFNNSIKQNIIELDLWVEKGTYVGGFNGANETIGTLILSFSNKNEQTKFINKLNEMVRVEVE